MIKEPTRTTSNSRTIIDHIITNRTDLVSSSGIIYCGISDHDVVFMQKKMRRPKLRLPPKTISVRNFKHFDRNEFLDDLKMAHFDEIKNYSNDGNEMWLLWKSLYIDILNKHAPVTNIRPKGSTLPYMTKDLKNMIRQRISDHDVVFMQKKMRRPKLRLSPKTISVRNFKHFDRNEFLDDLKMAHFDEIKNYSNDGNEMWLLWKSLYVDILNKHAPVTNIRSKGSTLPYMTKDLKNMIRQRDYLKAKAVKTGSEYLFQAFRQIRRRVFSSLKQLRKYYYTKKLKETKWDMKTTWKIPKSAMNQPTKANPIEKLVFNDEELTDSIKIAGTCNEHFASVGETLLLRFKI